MKRPAASSPVRSRARAAAAAPSSTKTKTKHTTTQKNRTAAARERVDAIAAKIPEGATIVRQYRQCGKKGCAKYHGPYWYAYWKGADGKTRSEYIGSDTRLGAVLKKRSDLRSSADEHDGEALPYPTPEGRATDKPIIRWTPTRNDGFRGRTQAKGRIYSVTSYKTEPAWKKKGYGPRSYAWQSTTGYAAPFKTPEDAQRAAEREAKAAKE